MDQLARVGKTATEARKVWDHVKRLEEIGAFGAELEVVPDRVAELTNRRGVDVVFEHVGSQTWPGSLLSMKRGGRLVTCGSTTGIVAPTKLIFED
ncbi:MAG: zinc-binding dehydrogenase [Nitrospira sp.]|nr:zinc-binding dehydrogenase [Nitrospira sp.]